MGDEAGIMDAAAPEDGGEALRTERQIPWTLRRLRYFRAEAAELLLRQGGYAGICGAAALYVLGAWGCRALCGEAAALLGLGEHPSVSAARDLLIGVLGAVLWSGVYLTLGSMRRGAPFSPGGLLCVLSGRRALLRCMKALLCMTLPLLAGAVLLWAGLKLSAALLLLRTARRWIAPAVSLGTLLLALTAVWMCLCCAQRLRLTLRLAWDHPQMSVWEAGNRSACITRGFCREGISLAFSWCGWWIPALLSCGLAQHLLLIPLLLSLQAVYDEYLLELHGARDGLDEAPNNERINAKGYI